MNLTNYRYNIQANPYHLVEPSPWPVLTSFSLLIFTITIVLYIHNYITFTLLGISLIIVIVVIILWLRDVTAEATYLGNHTFAVQKGLAIGFALFLISELIVFVSVFWAFFHSALSPTVEIGTHWPPIGIDALSPFEVPLLNTVLLLSSGATITYAHHALISNNRSAALYGTIITITLAILFTALQGFEYYTAGFTMSDSVYGTTFYASTGLHGFHVIVGTLLIIAGLYRLYAYHISQFHHAGLESAILYWHFVDGIWLFLYVSVYWWGA